MQILFVQIGSMGDCLLATPIAKQIKELDYPNCNLTWLIGDKFSNILQNNPYIDNIINIPLDYSIDSLRKTRRQLENILKNYQNFDKIIVTDICSKNIKHYYGTYRSTFFRIYNEVYGHKLNIDVSPIIVLSDEEKFRVKKFAEINALDKTFNIIWESSPRSGQSHINSEIALKISKNLIKNHKNIKCIFTSKEKLQETSYNIVDGSVLSFRECAELTKYCNLFVGSNSGITWLNLSTAGAKLPMIQCVNEKFHPFCSASVEMDLKILGQSTQNIIEFSEIEKLENCINQVLNTSFASAKKCFPEKNINPKEFLQQKKQLCEEFLAKSH